MKKTFKNLLVKFTPEWQVRPFLFFMFLLSLLFIASSSKDAAEVTPITEPDPIVKPTASKIAEMITTANDFEPCQESMAVEVIMEPLMKSQVI
tara:strand:- start:34781 stop:35059 length:279 start_codon:yes stop_codon:yes gene_type:complete